MPTYRQIFSNFNKSNVGRETKSLLYREQLFCCCSCKQSFPINKLEMHHLKPVKLLEQEKDIKNLTHPNNLVLLCRSCNSKQGSKIDKRFTD